MGAQSAKSSPPAGTGHVPGFGESFNINLNTGQGVYSYKVALPEGVAKHTPSLTLEYSSAHQYGYFGWGWDIGMRQVSRKLDSSESNLKEVYLDSGQEIVKMPDGTFRSRFESQHNKYERKPKGWIIHERNGIKHVLGTKASARLTGPQNRIFKWLIEKTIDTSGNEINYQYLMDEKTIYIDTIEYAIYKIQFHYEDRPDVRLDGRMGFLSKRRKLCQRIVLLVKIGATFEPQKTWTFNYQQEAISGVSQLKTINVRAHGDAADGSKDILLPEVKFDYQSYDETVYKFDFIKTEGRIQPPALTDDEASLINMSNSPLAGILQNQNGRQVYWENDGKGNWKSPRPISKVPFVSSFAQEGAVFGDMDASGNADMLILGPNELNGYYENKGKLQWGNFVAYPRNRRAFPETVPSNRFVDVDGNGVVDVIRSTKRAFHVLKNQRSEGWDKASVVTKSGKEIDQVNFEDFHYHLADMTGDGLMDIIKIGSGRIDYWPSLGDGRFEDRQTMGNAPRIPRLREHLEKCFFIDVNGSGCADLVFYDGKSFKVCYNQNGASFTDANVFDLLPPPLEGSIRPIDFYANGKTGLLYNTWSSSGHKYAYVTFGSTDTSFNLIKVSNGFGLESEIEYKPAIDFYNQDQLDGMAWKTHFPFPLRVVSAIRETDVITGLVNHHNMIYHNAHFNADRRQFQGFGRVEKIERGDNLESCPDKKMVYHYLMAQEFVAGNNVSHAALNGKLERVETFAIDGSALEEQFYNTEASTYKLMVIDPSDDGRERVVVTLDTYSQTHAERSGDRRVNEKKYKYDKYGNVIEELVLASGVENGNPVPGISSVIKYKYAINEAKWILDRVAVVAIYDSNGQVTSETRKYYDGAAFKGLDLGKVDKGLEVREARFVMAKTPFKAHYGTMSLASLGYYEAKDDKGADAIFMDFKMSKYNAKGLRVGERDAMGNSVDITFDATGLFRIKYSSVLGDNVYETDKKTASITKITGSDGGILRMNYDAMGRLKDVFSPDNNTTVPTRSYLFDDAILPVKRTTKFYQDNNPSNFSKVISYFDGASNEIQNRIECETGKYIVSEYKVMNPLGKVKREFQPYFSTSEDFDIPGLLAQPHQDFTFDVMGRPLQTINFLGGVSTAEYNVFNIVTSDSIDNSTDPDLVAQGVTNTPKVERFNVLMHRTETVVKLKNNQETKLRYHLAENGQLESIEDDKGTMATYVFDALGNRLVVDHREAGLRKVYYNAVKKPVKGEDANNNTITAEYDSLNRIKKLLSNGAEIETYTYDSIAQNAVGRLAEVRHEKGSQKIKYDANGQVIEKIVDFDDRPNKLTIKYSYDRLGRQIGEEHDDGTRIDYVLSPNGWINSITGIVKSIDYDPMGNPLKIHYENDVITSYSYFTGGKKIKTQRTVNALNQVFENLEYEYMPNGSLLKLMDKTSHQTITHHYKYNALTEIEKYSVTQGGNTDDHFYEYSDHLNLSKMGDTDLLIFRNDATKPALISKVKDKNNLETVLNYDNNGNLLNLPGRDFIYNFKHKISRIDRNDGLVAEYYYNHKEDRIQKTVTQGGITQTTFFIDNKAEYRDNNSVFFVYVGNIRVCMIRNGVKKWIHSNYLGNTNFYSDAVGSRIAQIAYKPFGNIASSTNNLPSHTFGTHPFDEESGLYYAKKRYYASEIGCFMSADPIAVFMPKRVIGSIKSFQCYAFVGNDPANNVDLSGLSFWSVMGAIVGVIVGVALVVFAGPLAALIIGIGIVTLSYVLASNNVNNDFGEFMRGFMIGFNAGMNAAIGSILLGPVIGIALGVINFLAAFDSVAQNEVYKGILGWSSWLMPMSWIVTGLGLLFVVINLIVAGVTGNQIAAVSITSISVDWQTGSIIMEGGLITNPAGGFNMGNFSFLGNGATVGDHEIGHGLNLGAFGWVFHFVGAIDENWIQTNPTDAYSEHLAESNEGTAAFPAPPAPGLDMWTA